MKIDLSNLPEGTKWISIDKDGYVVFHYSEPLRSSGGYYSDVEELLCDRCIGNVHD